MVKLTEVISYVSHVGHGAAAKNKEIFNLREVYVNPEYVVMLREDDNLDAKHKEAPLIRDLARKASFTKVSVNAGTSSFFTMSVVGSKDVINEKLGKA